MKAFEFSARMDDGVIEVPAYCVGHINPGDKVRVIVLIDGRDSGGGFRSERRPFKRRFDGGDRDGGGRDFSGRDSGGYNSDRKPFKKRFGGDRDFGGYNSDRKPFKKRFGEDRDGGFRSDRKPFKKRFDETTPDTTPSTDLE